MKRLIYKLFYRKTILKAKLDQLNGCLMVINTLKGALTNLDPDEVLNIIISEFRDQREQVRLSLYKK
ncbi:MAG: hypothetical protein M0R17_04540 [Candidatus Omnitrophica bacterium]|jgi:hypothetical protein|nr:hypothetical protein [Candidatus Omnitrophota bacterium]